MSEGTPVSILRKSISGRHRPVNVADGPMTPDVGLRRRLAGTFSDVTAHFTFEC